MKRRKFLQGAAAGGVAAAAATISAPAISQGIKQLKMVTTWPKNFPGLGTGAETSPSASPPCRAASSR